MALQTTEHQILESLEQAAAASLADQTELFFASSETATTRFANNQIHQNVSRKDRVITCRAVLGRRIGMASTNRDDHASIAATVRHAEAIAALQLPDPDFVSLPEPAAYRPLAAFDEAAAACTPEQRSAAIGRIVTAVQGAKLSCAGQFSTGQSTLAVVNSLGVRAFHQATEAEITLTAMDGDDTGYAEAASVRLGDLDPDALARRAIHKALANRHAAALDPGEYTVVLEEAAVGDMLMMLNWMGLSAQDYQEGTSFLNGHMGALVTGPSITLRDDAYHPLTVHGRPFDGEGAPKAVVYLIDHGVAKGCVYDSYLAHKCGMPNTGHAPSPSERAMGPIAMNLVLEPGNSNTEAMIASTERGLLVTRFWYTRVVDKKQTIFTGMTRDGTFLIEDGRVTKAVQNLRFNQNILESLANADALGSTLQYATYAVTPSARIRNFRFTG